MPTTATELSARIAQLWEAYKGERCSLCRENILAEINSLRTLTPA